MRMGSNIPGASIRGVPVCVLGLRKKILHMGRHITHNEVVRIWGLTYLFRLGSYQLTIIERNSGVEYKGNSRVVEKSSLRIANMNSKGLSDCEFNLLKGVDRWCWGGE